MSLFLIKTDWIDDRTVGFPRDESHHLITVLRKQVKDQIRCRDQTGQIHLLTITKADRESAQAVITDSCFAKEDRFPICLITPILKSQRSEWIVQKATELGCERIIPYFFENSVVRPKQEKHTQRMRKIAHAAAKQSERSRPPEIEPEVLGFGTLKTRVEAYGKTIGLLAWENSTQPLYALLAHLPQEINSLTLVIGPEGGLSRKELEQFDSIGFKDFTLGNNILRSETAAIVSLANIIYALRQSWNC